MNVFVRNLPNFLTAMRVAAAPALAALLLGGFDRAALGVFAFAGLTDAADGYLAKRFNLATRFGRYLDPAADKLLMLTSFLVLTALGIAPLWLTALVIGRDIAIVLGIGLARMLELPVRVTPNYLGKVSMAVQVGYVALLLLMLTLEIDSPPISSAAAIVTAVITLASGLAYAQILLRAATRRRSRPA